MAASDEDLDLETPQVDRVEQRTAVIDEPDEDAALGDVAVSEVLEANEADVLEQAIAVPTDEDYPSDGA